MVSLDNSFVTKDLTIVNFENININNICRLGKCNYLKAQPPLSNHIHKDCFEICYHIKGSQIYEVEGSVFETCAGDIFITFPNEIHGSGINCEEKSSLFFLIFNCMNDTENFLGLNSTDSMYIRNTLFSISTRKFKGNSTIKKILDNIIEMYFSSEPLKESRIQGLFIEFFYQLTLVIKKSTTDFNVPKDIQYIINYIDNNLDKPLTIDDLSALIFLSTPQFKRKFKQYTGFSPGEYVCREKIKCSTKMLKNTSKSITTISLELGFSSSQHFSSVFKKYMHCTPSFYRKSSDI